jgi:hypothetical protein
MLRTALEFIQDELNAYIKNRDPVNFGNKNLATLSNIMKQDGSFEFDSADDTNDHKIIISLVNVVENRVADCQNYVRRNEDGIIQNVNPAVNLEFYILFSAYSDDYKSSLRNLTFVISFFQTNAVFTLEKYPHLNTHAGTNKPWQKIQKLIFNLENLSFEQQNNLWGAIGAKFMPSLIYKMKLLRFQELEAKTEAPPVLEANIVEH